MLVFVVSFLFGTAQLLWLPTLSLGWLFFAVIVFVLGVVKYNRIFFGVSLGFALAIISGIYAKSHQLQTIPTENITVIGTINNLPTQKHDRTRFSFKVKEHKLKKLLVSWYNTQQQVQAGQHWQFELKLKPIHGYKNPGSFDYSKWLFRQGYDATATVKSAKLLSIKSNSINSIVNNLRSKIAELIQQKFNSPRVIALIQALTIGDKSQISYQDSQLFQDTGTAHLIAISGLHIGLIAFVGVLFGRLCFFVFTNERFNRFKFEAIFAISFALIYALLAGLSIPTIRALVMVVVFALAHIFKQQISRWQAWSIAMLIVLVIDPFSVLDVGFWFSFGAVAALMFAFTGRKLSKNVFSAFIKAQLIILIGLLPLMVMVFQKINLLTPFANILVLPLASLLLIPLIFITIFVYLFSSILADFLFMLVEKISLLLFAILDYLQQFNFLNLRIHNINTTSIFLLIMVMTILLLPRLFRWRFIAIFLLIPLFLKNPSQLAENDFQVNVLDVGQGLAVVVTTKEHTLIYDTGAKFDSGFNLASAVVIPFLQNQGIVTIDKIIISHDDNDHAGGITVLQNSYSQAQVLGVTTDYRPCQHPNIWHWNGVEFKIISPYTLQPYLGNNSSCVLKISSPNGSILLTGDIEEPIEYRLVKNFVEEIKSEVMLVPHHGSRTSSSAEFVRQVNAKIAINSAGYANQFNHPHPSIKGRYLDTNTEFYDTQDKGMIELLFTEQQIRVHQYGDMNQHFWQVKH